LLEILFAILSVALLVLIWRMRIIFASLQASERRFTQLFLDSIDPIVLVNRDCVYVDCNIAALSWFDIETKTQVIGRPVGSFTNQVALEILYPGRDMALLIREQVDTAFSLGRIEFDWVTVVRGHLHYSHIVLRKINVGDQDQLLCVFRDVTDVRYSETLLEGQNQLLQMIGEGNDLVFILRETVQFLERLSPKWRCALLLIGEDDGRFNQAIAPNLPVSFRLHNKGRSFSAGLEPWDAVALTAAPLWLDDLVSHPIGVPELLHQLEYQDFVCCGVWPVIGKLQQTLGVLCIFSSESGLIGKKESRLIGIAQDIAAISIENTYAETEILRLAHYDDLTTLPNRYLFNSKLNMALAFAQAHNRHVGVLFLDMDRFKNINDTFGHDEGDAVLQQLASRFTACLRETDIIARIGGDEFLVLVDDLKNAEDLGDVAAKLLAAATLPFEIQGHECQLTVSIGVVGYPEDGIDAQTLLKNADIAMYRAKNAGKNNYRFYAAELNTHTIERMAFESSLRKSIERGDFVVYYQPKINLMSGQIVGGEALVRWQHPERGLLYPMEFIAMAEETGLIGRLGLLVLDMVCHDIVDIRLVKPDFGRIAINLSGSQFSSVTLLDEIMHVLDFWQVDPSCFEFEITESMVMHNRDQAIMLMDQLRLAGFTLSIDDFGTGYSSLAYLKRFSVDSVKIDHSFIKDFPEDPNDTAIVLAIVAMAHTLGLKVIAEGVESTLQLDMLRASGCDEYQGFYFSEAVPKKQFIEQIVRYC